MRFLRYSKDINRILAVSIIPTLHVIAILRNICFETLTYNLMINFSSENFPYVELSSNIKILWIVSWLYLPEEIFGVFTGELCNKN